MKAAFIHGGAGLGRIVGPNQSRHSVRSYTASQPQRNEAISVLNFWLIVGSKNEGEIIFALRRHFDIQTDKTVHELCGLFLEGDDQSLREAVLRAVDLENVSLTETVLDKLKETKLKEDESCRNSLVFPSHMTPLLLACIKNNFELVSLLLNRGHQIIVPHRPDCKCKRCSADRKMGENVESQVMRIDAFRAMSSSAHLWFASHDPILLSIQLSTELQKSAEVDTQFKDQYTVIVERVRKFALSVAQQCRSEAEVHTLLTRQEGITKSSASFPLPRLRLALDSNMKQFCSDLSIQSEIGVGFKGKWADWAVCSPSRNFFFRILPHTLFYPFTSLLFLFSGGRLFKSYNYPFARYMSYFASYLLFLACLTYLIQDTTEGNIRGFSRNKFKLAISSYTWFYIFGMLWFDFLGFARIGIRRFFAVWWNWFDTVQWILFMIAFFAFVRAELDAHADGLREIERRNWVFWDSQLVGEAFYGTATVVSFWRVFYFLQLNRTVGPTIISIGRCIRDIFRYLIILAAVLCSFSAGIKYIYYGYAGYFTTNHKTGDIVHQQEHFLSWPQTLRMLYWAFYGYLPPHEQVVVTGSLGLGRKQEGSGHWLTETIGEIIIASFHICTIIVLLNLMIAMICTTASSIIENEDVEWKFIRCHVWAEFFEESNSLPPPFNVIHWFIQWIWFAIYAEEKKFKWPDLWYAEPKEDKKKNQEYLDLIAVLFRRYQSAEGRTWKTAPELAQECSVKSVRFFVAKKEPENLTKEPEKDETMMPQL